MRLRDYIFSALLLSCLCGLVYCWVWWFRTGRHEPGEHTGRAIAGLAYGTLSPLLLIGLVPMCYVPLGENLIVGLPFVAVGLILALMGGGKLRRLLAAYALTCLLMFLVASPSSPPDRTPTTKQTATGPRGCPRGGL